MEGHSDADLISCAVAGDRDAFAAVVARHYALIYRTAYKWCGCRSDAEDVAQDVCVKLGHAIRGFDGRSAFSSWLYRITLNTVRDRVRYSARQARRVAEFAVVSEGAALAADAPDPMEDLWSAVRKLPDAERDAVMLVYSEGLSHAEAGRILDCAEGTVSWRINKAKKQLKVLLDD